jgi:membrane fusion protein, multidrug efflux system
MLFRLWTTVPCFSLLALFGCAGRDEKAADASTAVQPVTVTVAPLEIREVERTVDVVGTLKGWEEVTVGAKLKAMGVARVLRVDHDMGDRVKPGDLLVELETIDSDLAVSQAERQLQAELAKLGLTSLPSKDFDVSQVPSVVQSKVALERAKQNLVRERSLNQRGAGTFQDYQNAENDVKASEAALENAVVTARSTVANAQASKVALDVARQARIDMEIRAPVPSAAPKGHERELVYAVTKRFVSEGQMLKQGDPVYELVVENPLRLWANVPERSSSDVQLEQPVRVKVAAHPGQVFLGKVARINPSIDPASRTFQVETWVPNDQGMLKPGGFAKASILTRRNAQAKTVPLESVVKFAGVSKLFVVDGQQAREIKVETGLEGAGWVEVIGPVPDRALVVTSGQTRLADGTKVIVREPEPASKTAFSNGPTSARAEESVSHGLAGITTDR